MSASINLRLGGKVLLTAITAAALCTGCANRQKRENVRTASTDAVLAAARASQISMFGDLAPGSGGAAATRPAVPLRQHTFTDIGHDFDPDVDPSGSKLVFASTRHSRYPDLYLKSVTGVAITQLTADPAADVQPAFSPDGTRLAFASDRSGNWDIWVMRLDSGQAVQITQSLGEDIHPSWSPDGRRLVYCSRPLTGGEWELWLADVDTAATRKFIGFGLFPVWSPVRDEILFQRARERGGRLFSIWTIQLVDGEPRYPTELATSSDHALTLPTWSKDGYRIGFVSVPAGVGEFRTGSVGSVTASDVWLMSADGSDQIRLTDGFTGNHSPVFSPDGRLYFTSGRAGAETIWSLRPDAGGLGEDDGRTTLSPADRRRVLEEETDQGRVARLRG